MTEYTFANGHKAMIGSIFVPAIAAAYLNGPISTDEIKAVIRLAKPDRDEKWIDARTAQIVSYTTKHGSNVKPESGPWVWTVQPDGKSMVANGKVAEADPAQLEIFEDSAEVAVQ